MTNLMLDPFSYLQRLYISVDVIETFDTQKDHSDYLAKLKKQHVELIAKSASTAKSKLAFLDSNSPFRRNIDPTERIVSQNRYLEVSKVHDEAQKELRQFEIANMKILQDFSKHQRIYTEAQVFVSSHLRAVTIFSCIHTRVETESLKFFLFPANTNSHYFGMSEDYGQAVSSEAPIGNASLGRVVGENYSVVLPNGRVANFLLEEIKIPTGTELLSLINSWGQVYPITKITSALDTRENRNHRDRHRTPY